MVESAQGVTSDITDEDYKGPNAAVAAAGEGSIAHFGLGFVGLIAGFIATYIFHEPVANFIARQQVKGLALAAKEGATKGEKFWGKMRLSLFGHPDKNALVSLLKPAEEVVKDGGGKLVHEIATGELARSGRGWLYNISDEIRRLPGVKQLLGFLGTDNDAIKRIDTAIIGGGILGAFGTFIAPIAFWITGAKHASEGKHQFERAKEEIHTMRAQYDSLREKYVEATTKLEEARVGRGVQAIEDIRHAAPKREEIKKKIETPTAQVSSITHDAMLAAAPAQAISN